ncbi:hypothetical protein SAMN05192575_102129 [Nocardioides alpinus]|uniref:Uncharacterized protein n=1 Tax=Nocardioides alpinus TaxID=748909 RepID=A0A1I0X5V1_9ACTN|nr:hypothetical protein [Nocardioides alpinus]PKH44114.1 hypothetical protein CXG46_00685 [Nocardioides alpinus]SFA95766.1 hypothetical protein SAMN05192575_102129 [Nocardioides alpinus]
MIDQFLARLNEPRFGITFLTAVTSLVMASHWPPMAVPSLALLALFVARPNVAAHPAVWWIMAVAWFAAQVVVPERMEDHVPLFAIWLVAVALCLHRPAEEFLAAAAFQARMLVGVTFGAAVAWKVYFGTYLDGVTLWTYMIADERFRPLSTVLGLSDDAIQADRKEISQLLSGDRAVAVLESSGLTVTGIVAVSVLTLVLEIVISLSHLVSDRSRLARLRLPSLVLFGVVTYGVVPVLPFALLLALFAMTVAGWRRDVMWVLPTFMIVIAIRVATLAF